MAAHDYIFVTHWRMPGTCAQVYEVLEQAADLPRWWGMVYLRVREVDAGGDDGVGRTFDLHTRGWLPYELRWQLVVTGTSRPTRISFSARGDFNGTGAWLFRQDGDDVDIRFDWAVRADKPLLRRLSWLMKPVFAANHRWAMARGEEGLRAELASRFRPSPGRS